MKATFTSPVFWSLVGTAVIAGLGSIVGLVPANVASWITIILTVLGALVHSNNVVAGKSV